MSNLRDHAATARRRLGNGRVRVSDAWYRAAGQRIRSAHGGFSNWRNRRTIARGRTPRWEGALAALTSRMPVYRNRINPAHGNPRREDARLHRLGNESLKRMPGHRASAVRAEKQRYVGAVRAGGYGRTAAREQRRLDSLNRHAEPRTRGRSR